MLNNGEYKIEVNGIKHWVKIAGIENNNTPVFILHGGPGGNHYVFERTVGKDIERFSTVIYYEQRGCGRSEQPKSKDDYSIELLMSDLYEIIKCLGFNRVKLLGYSFGGQLAMEFTLQYPQFVEKLILQNPAVQDERLTYCQIQSFKHISEGEIRTKINEIIKSSQSLAEKLNLIWNQVDLKTVDRFLFFNPNYAFGMRKMWDEFEFKNTGDMALALSKEKREIPLLEDLKNISVPTLFLVGLYDRNIGVDLLRDMHQNIRHSKLILFEKSAHFPDLEEPIKYINSIKDFI